MISLRYKGFKIGDHIKFNAAEGSVWELLSYVKTSTTQTIKLIGGAFGTHPIGFKTLGSVSRYSCEVVFRKHNNKPYYPDWF